MTLRAKNYDMNYLILEKLESIDKRFDTIDRRFETIDSKLNLITEKMAWAQKTFDDYKIDVDRRFDEVKKQAAANYEELNKNIMTIESRTYNLTAEIMGTDNRNTARTDAHFKWIIGVIISLFIASGVLPSIITAITESVKSLPH